jgi:hypothetical protein
MQAVSGKACILHFGGQSGYIPDNVDVNPHMTNINARKIRVGPYLAHPHER